MRNLIAGSLAAALLLAGATPALAMRDIDRRLFVSLTSYSWDPAQADAALAKGADVNARNEALNDETLLILAIKGRVVPEVVKWLVDHGADPGMRDRSGKSALDWGHQYGLPRRPDGARIMALMGDRPAVAPRPSAQAPAPVARQVDASPARASRPSAPNAPIPMGGPAPSPGVYECINQQAMISPMAFGILDGSTYMSSMGKRGRYAYDAGTGVLSLDPGATPARFQRISPTTFRVITESGQLGGFTCPLNRAKNPSRPPW
jgi:hypothetical protein